MNARGQALPIFGENCLSGHHHCARSAVAYALDAALGLAVALLIGCTHTPAQSTDEESNAAAVEELVVTSPVPQADEMESPQTQRAAEIESFDPSRLQYRISAGDVLAFTVVDDDSMDRDVTVRFDGKISLPFVDDIYVAGLTPQEATEIVRDAYTAVLQEPLVELDVLETPGTVYTIIGDVSRPDVYPYERPISLLEGITIAGGPRIDQRGGDSFVSAQGQLVKAFVLRGKGPDREVLEFDLADLERPGSHAENAPIYPGDTIYIPEGVNLVYVLGELGEPDVYEMTPNMTLFQLVATAQSFNASTARIGHLILIRQLDNSRTKLMQIDLREMLSTGQDLRLEPGDIVYVPRKRLLRLEDFVSRLTSIWTNTLRLYTDTYDAYRIDDRFELLEEAANGRVVINP